MQAPLGAHPQIHVLNVLMIPIVKIPPNLRVLIMSVHLVQLIVTALLINLSVFLMLASNAQLMQIVKVGIVVLQINVWNAQATHSVQPLTLYVVQILVSTVFLIVNAQEILRFASHKLAEPAP